jgi:hypothetical protein
MQKGDIMNRWLTLFRDAFVQWQYRRFTGRDLWREARAKHQAGLLHRLIVFLLGLLGKRALPFSSLASILRADRALIVDLSSYNPNVNIEGLIDAGVRHFFLRMLYIGTYVYDHWDLTEDSTYRAYYDQIKAYAKQKGVTVWIGGYILYTAGVEDQDYVNSHIYTDLVGQIMGTAYRPDILFIDDEICTWWQNNKTTTATDVNQIKGCQELRRKLWERFHIVVGYYGGRWFVNKYLAAYTVMFDNINKCASPLDKPMPIWMAWYPVTLSDLFLDIWLCLDKLPTPTSTQKVALLDAPGSYSPCDGWQFTGGLITNYYKDATGKPAGLDFSVSYNSIADFNHALGLGAPADDSGDGTTGDGSNNPDLAAMAARLTVAEQDIASLKQFRDHVKDA